MVRERLHFLAIKRKRSSISKKRPIFLEVSSKMLSTTKEMGIFLEVTGEIKHKIYEEGFGCSEFFGEGEDL